VRRRPARPSSSAPAAPQTHRLSSVARRSSQPTTRGSITGARISALAAGFITLLLAGFGFGELSESIATGQDLAAVRDVASDRFGQLTAIAHAFSQPGSSVVLVPLALITCAVLWRRGRATRALTVAISVAGAIAISSLDKVLVARIRPPVHHLEAVSSASFPSGHTTQTTAFCLALVLTLLAKRPPRMHGLLAVLAAVGAVAAVATSRIYLGVHYPTDIAGGVVVGGGWTVLVYMLLSHPRRGDPSKTTHPGRPVRLPRGNESLRSIVGGR